VLQRAIAEMPFNHVSSDDMYAQDSIELLQKSGIDFKRLEMEGIDNDVFAEHLITSGLVLFTNVKWVSFHS
jgi:CCR4-NOT transcription complex subunit 7/8